MGQIKQPNPPSAIPFFAFMFVSLFVLMLIMQRTLPRDENGKLYSPLLNYMSDWRSPAPGEEAGR